MESLEIHSKNVEEFILKLLDKYAKRQSIYEPLTKILGDFSNVPELRAIRNVMFERIEVPVIGSVIKNSIVKIWMLKKYIDVPNNVYVSFIAKRVVSETVKLRKIIWYKNGWGNPYIEKKKENLTFEYKVAEKDGDISIINYPQFRERYLPKLICFLNCHNQKSIESLLHSIYSVITDAFQTGTRQISTQITSYQRGKRVGKEETIKENIEFINKVYNKILLEENNFIHQLKDWLIEEANKTNKKTLMG